MPSLPSLPKFSETIPTIAREAKTVGEPLANLPDVRRRNKELPKIADSYSLHFDARSSDLLEDIATNYPKIEERILLDVFERMGVREKLNNLRDRASVLSARAVLQSGRLKDRYFPPLKPGEIFDPEKEIAAIRETRLTDAGKSQELRERFRERLAYQINARCLIDRQLTELMETRPDASETELHSVLKGFEDQYGGFPPEYQKLAETGVANYVARRKGVTQLLTECTLENGIVDKRKLHTEVFGFDAGENTDKFDVGFTPYTVEFYTEDPDLLTLQERACDEGIITAGLSRHGSATYLPGRHELGRALVIMKGRRLLETTTQGRSIVKQSFDQVLNHERSHCKRALMFEIPESIGAEASLASVKAELNALVQNHADAGNLRQAVQSAMEVEYRDFFSGFRNPYADEFLAFYGTGVGFEHASLIVTVEPAYDGLGAFKREVCDVVEKEIRESGDRDKAFVLRMVFDDWLGEGGKFKTEVAEQLKGAQRLEQAGYSRQEIVEILTYSPLGQWQKTADILIG